MDYLQNHCWCSDSNWGGIYHCRHMVSLNGYRRGYKEDWNTVIDENSETYFDHESFAWISGLVEGREPDREKYYRPVNGLKPHVIEWLETHVADRKDDECNKGWCIGSTEYRKSDSCSNFSIFFHRRKDAMAFIRRFSKYKKPIHYCQYFSDVRKRLNLETLQYEDL